jgi:cell division protein FtsZ
VNEAAEIISQAADPDANIIFGAVVDENLEDEVRVTVIATGFDSVSKAEKENTVVDLRSFTSDDLDIPAFLRKR